MRVALPALAVLLASCGDAGPQGVPGIYTLRRIGEEPLPATILHDSQSEVEVVSAAVRLDDDFSFLDARLYRITQGTSTVTQADTVRGTYSQAGDKIDFVSTSGDRYQMVWGGHRLTH